MKFNEKDNIVIHWVMVAFRLCEVICVIILAILQSLLKGILRFITGAFKADDDEFTGI
ncbi:MAG: hypothetical protein J6E46_01085 [Faecalicoccus sp.]|nr:hypothetical protein [Faecalicoccus sp.]